MQCLDEKREGGNIRRKKKNTTNSSFSQSLAKLFLAFNDTSHHHFMGSFERREGGTLCYVTHLK